jgi:hypothetical protein
MKAVESHSPAATAKKSNRPFFNKGSDNDFFGGSPFIQTKLSVGAPDSKFEKEADSMADKVVQQKPIFESNAEPPDEEGSIRRKSDFSGAKVSPAVENGISSSKGSGNKLPPDVNRSMSNSFGSDFSGVNIHNDSSSAGMNTALRSQAFTHGNDIYFNSGKYDPQSTSGKRLLAHELTHTLQQGGGTNRNGGIQKKEDLIQRYPQAGEVLPSTKKQERFYKYRNEVVDLSGTGTFQPGTGLGNYIVSMSENGQDTPVNVKFGSHASGYIYVRYKSTHEDDCITVPTFNMIVPFVTICKVVTPDPAFYYAASQVIPFDHPGLKNTSKGSTVLQVGVTNGFIYGKLGWIEGKIPDEVEPVMDAAAALTNEEVFLPFIYGTEYDGSNYASLHFNNDIIGGDLAFTSVGTLQLANQQRLGGIFGLDSSGYTWLGELSAKPMGLEAYKIPVDRTPDAKLSGSSVSLQLDGKWVGGDKESEHGIFVVTGQLIATYANGSFEVFGKATYSSSRINGEVNIAITQLKKAQAIFAEHAPGKKTKAAEGPLPTDTNEEGAEDPLALTAWGNLHFKLIKAKKAQAQAAGAPQKKSILDDLEGEGAFVVSPEGYIILSGKLKFPTKWELTKRLDYNSESAEDPEKHLFAHKVVDTRAPVYFGTVGAEIGITIDAYAHLSPLELYEIEVSGVYSNHPDYRSEVDITPRFYISGFAGAKLKATLELAYKLGGIFTLGKFGGSLTGTAEVAAFVDAAPTVRKIWEGGEEPAKYALEGIIHTGGTLTFTLTGEMSIEAFTVEIFKSKEYHIGTWELGSFGAQLKMNEYILGSGETPVIDYSKMGLTGNQRRKLASAITYEREKKKEAEDKRTGGFTQEEDGKQVEKGKFSQKEIERPKHDDDPVGSDQEEEFLMMDELHELILTITGTRKAPKALLEMSSGKKKPLKKKIAEERKTIADQKAVADPDTATLLNIQESDLSGIEKEAASVEKNAEGAAQNTAQEEEPVVAGFTQIDDSISSYGKKFNKTDLGDPAAPSPTPPAPQTICQPRIPGADSESERLLFEGRVDAGYASFDDFRGTNIAVFRYVILPEGVDRADPPHAKGPFYESSVNRRRGHSEELIAGKLDKMVKTKKFNKKFGYGSRVVVTLVVSERSPCSNCRNFLIDNPSSRVRTNNNNTVFLVHYSGGWIERNRALMLKYCLKPPSLEELRRTQAGSGRDPDPH